ELGDERKVHLFDLSEVVVAKQDGLPIAHRTHVLLSRDEQTTRDPGESDRVDPALLELLHVEEVLHAEGGHREYLERPSISAAALVARRGDVRLLGMGQR